MGLAHVRLKLHIRTPSFSARIQETSALNLICKPAQASAVIFYYLVSPYASTTRTDTTTDGTVMVEIGILGTGICVRSSDGTAAAIDLQQGQKYWAFSDCVFQERTREVTDLKLVIAIERRFHIVDFWTHAHCLCTSELIDGYQNLSLMGSNFPIGRSER